VKANPTAGPGSGLPARPTDSGRILSLASWIIALILVGFALYLGWRLASNQPLLLSALPSVFTNRADSSKTMSNSSDHESPSKQAEFGEAMPDFIPSRMVASIFRRSDLHTAIPNRPDEKVRSYTVTKGDSVFDIAARFKIKPETVLWANYEQLNDNPDMISVGMPLLVPPTNGVLYKWQDGDTVEGVAGKFEAKPENILAWSGNNIDLVEPKIEPGALIFVPGGQREFRQWLIPTIPRGNAGVSPELYGGGACSGNFSGAYGSGAFIWPAANHILSGNDYWSGHLGIDIAAGEGAQIYAADSGVVVFAGWANGGYGNMVMIDHGNGYQTVYAHLSNVAIGCGRSVNQGAIIGYAGSTGNSTGAHLHFEVRYQGGFVSPWYVLPAP
jgi:murein DD-endopeptidase MepM/ murein hydrolase activator NlpD